MQGLNRPASQRRLPARQLQQPPGLSCLLSGCRGEDSSLTEFGASPADVVLPRVEEVSCRAKVVLVSAPHRLADIKQIRRAAMLAQGLHDPRLED